MKSLIVLCLIGCGHHHAPVQHVVVHAPQPETVVVVPRAVVVPKPVVVVKKKPVVVVKKKRKKRVRIYKR